MFKKSFIILLSTTLLAGNVLAATDELPPALDAAADSASTISTTTSVDTSTSLETSASSTSSETSTTTSGTTATSTLTKETKGFEDFNDVSVEHPYYNAIIVLRYQGVLAGYPDNTFHPDQPLNRVEALKLVFEVAKLDLNTGIAPAKFSDTEASTWYTSYLNKAVFLEIVSGYPDGSFKPAQSVNLVEFLKMLELGQKVDLSKTTLAQIPYADVMPGQWYSKYVNFAKINDLLDTDDQNNIRPDQPLTRGRAAEIIYRFRNMLAKPAPAQPAEENPDTGSQPSASAEFGLYVSESYKFAIKYPRNWFYSSITSTDQTAIRTYGFGPKDLLENDPVIKLELLPNDENFQANLDYQGFMYKKTTLDDGSIQLSAKINGSTRVYRLSGPAGQDEAMMTMLTSLTVNIDGLETTTYATNSDDTTNTSDTTTTDTSTTPST